MIRRIFFANLLDTQAITEHVSVIRDGYMNLYIIRGPDGLVCVDAGCSRKRVVAGFAVLNLDIRDVAVLLLTHLHWDHAGAWAAYPEARIYAGEGESLSRLLRCQTPLPSLIRVRDQQLIEAAGLSVRVVSTRGHTPGSVSYLVDDRLLFTGDAVRLKQGEALPFHSWLSADGHAMKDSIRKIARLDGVEHIFTGHDGVTGNPDYALKRWRDPHIVKLLS